ncbi:carboxymuconolactone decarboxylase family protein [Pleionea sp. CnH1-48]|uniref:carboxymuconolactone decarboxylase family protein n=1 Tax=Pleionea sp. CnH1-48 TaxID=2954494 RepID=UPI00209802B6|nr:peroxidase-related enzyme [Pleionea sp. CnH1-48]MCO7223079.1 peroxidase-related enzyme [Pleionea sp. CnH1-48]
MAFINTIQYQDATGKLKKIYERVKGPNNNVDNILVAQSLRPHSLEGHMSLYKNVLHHSGNKLDKAYLEIIGVYVSLLNQCEYCVEHHFAGLLRQMNNNAEAHLIRKNLESDQLIEPLTPKQQQGLMYARKLTIMPSEISSLDIETCRELGFSDGEILEINQVTAYFNYANRTVLGLGVSLEGDILGLSPNSDSPDDWSHQTVENKT